MKRLFIICSLIIANCSLAFSAAPKASEYFYQKEVQVSPSLVGQTIGVRLEPKDMQLISPVFKNVQVVDKNNDPVSFEAYIGQSEKKKKGYTILDVSSQKEDDPRNLLDNDVLTTYTFDKKMDGKNPATLLIDLGRVEWVNRVNMFYSDRKTIRTYEIEGGLSLDKVRTIKKRTAIKQTTEFTTPRAMRYMRIKWWGQQIKLDDIQIYTSAQGAVYFDPQPGQTYKVLFGNPQVRSVRYGARYSNPLENITIVEAGRTKVNELLTNDVDGDGIPNIEDNCLGIKNKSQSDKDSDLVGDECDNAPESKNRYQYDTDRDDIGDIIDNCKLDYNPNQKDRDDDGFGNECDNAHASEPIINSKNKPYFLYGILLVLGFGIIAMFISEKFSKSEANK